MTYLISTIVIPLAVAFVAGCAVADWNNPRPPRWVKRLHPRHRRRAAAIRRLHDSQA